MISIFCRKTTCPRHKPKSSCALGFCRHAGFSFKCYDFGYFVGATFWFSRKVENNRWSRNQPHEVIFLGHYMCMSMYMYICEDLRYCFRIPWLQGAIAQAWSSGCTIGTYIRRFLQKGDSVFVSTVGRHFKGYYSKLAKLHHCILWAHIAIENDPFVDVLPVISMIIFQTQITRSYAAYHFYSHIHGQPWVNPV
jgi:hypothetical protein